MMSLDRRRRLILAGLALFTLLPASAFARDAYMPPAPDSIHAVPAEHGLVVAQEKFPAIRTVYLVGTPAQLKVENLPRELRGGKQ